MKAVLVQEHWVEWNEVNYEKTGNILLSRIMGAEVRLDPAGFDIGFRASWEKAIQDVIDRGGKPYAIPAGASDHDLGGHGFAGWAFEVEDQEKELGFKFDKTIVCTVTGSSQAGMIAGFAHSNRAQDVIGIDASATVQQTWEQTARIARRTANLIELGREIKDEEIVLLDRWHDGVYGVASPKTIEHIKLVANLEGMITDPVYEGKSITALVDLVKEGYFKEGSRVLYCHLGGQPAINGYTTAF
jgi:1-aminocyclopropane-1-carboxylate deaminase